MVVHGPLMPVFVPADLAALFPEGNVSSWAIESLVIAAVREEQLSRPQGANILGLSWAESEELYARNGLVRDYSVEDVDKDLTSLKKLFG